MKNILKTLSIMCFLLFMCFLFAKANKAEENFSLLHKSDKAIKISPKLKEKYPLKAVHEHLSLKCIYCHEGQGDEASKFELPDEEVCLACHKSKKYLAKRLEFMDTLKSNPHNSVHDGPNLYCDECHKEHEASVNMCAECHEREIKNNIWMKDTP